MKTRGDSGSDGGSSRRSQEERGIKNEGGDSDSSSSSSSKKTTTTRSNSEKQQQELLRKLDSIKGHLLRGKSQDLDQPQSPIGFHGQGGPSYYTPYPYGMYPPTHLVPAYMHRTPHNWYPPPYLQGQYVDIGPDILDPQLHDPRFFPVVTPTRYAADVPPYSPVSHHGPFSPHGDVQAHHHTRWPSDISSEMAAAGAFARGYVHRAVQATDTRRCHPLEGGAPFVACYSCFELLYLPRKKLIAKEKQQTMQCGACSEVFSFTILDNKLLFSYSATTVEVDNPPVLKDEESKKQQETKIVQDVSPSEHSDDDGRSSISSEPQKEVVKSVRRRVKAKGAADSPPPPPKENPNLLELFEFSNINRAAMTYGMEQLGYKKQESHPKQDFLKPESVVANKTDVSYKSEVSEDLRISNASKEEMMRQRNRQESSESIYSEVTSNTSNDQNDEQIEVWVNGHLIPEELVISAEKQAGPVQGGKYWYDYRAGFWGVMGNPCLGVIPPFIEEFSRPMPDNCGAGNTSVVVNGRELHERDLELLSSRGLPQEKNRCYIVDISGRVLDGDSGEELKGLGKLAPTIEKLKHGFGMRVPRPLLVSSD